MLVLIVIICYHYRCNTYHELDEIMNLCLVIAKSFGIQALLYLDAARRELNLGCSGMKVQTPERLEFSSQIIQ